MPATRGQPYEQELTDQPLAVLPGSRVELEAQATTALREAVVVGPDGQTSTQPLNGADCFGFEFTADKPSSIKLSGVSTDGLASGEAKELRIVLTSDEPPQFKLVSPESDYLATDVASIPISFDVTDDFGLARAQLVCELPGCDPVVLESASPQRAKRCSLAHVLELEQYDLHVGDSILFYATARDVDTGHRPGDANACSEVYFIEIRPYRQFWHPESGGDQPNSMPGIAEDLITILEYTRAVVKKTWTLARSPGAAEEDRPKLEALSADVQYCATRLAKIRDDPEAGFGDADKAVLNEVLKSYEQAGRQLDRRDADGALSPAQEAYRILRMFIDELHLKWMPPQNGPSSPQETPERVKLQEQPQEPKMEKERVESRLREMQQNIDSLARQEQSLKADLAKALQQEKDAAARPVETQNLASPRQGPGEKPGDQSRRESATPSQGEQSGTEGARGEGQDGAQTSPQESAASKSGGPEGQSGQSGKGQGEQSGEPQSGQGAQAGGGQRGQAGEGQSGPSGGQSAEAQSGQGAQAGEGQSGQTGDRQGDGMTQPNSVDRGGSSGQARPEEGAPPNKSGGGAQAGEEAGQSGEGPGGASAQADARMRMLQAKQKALREQTSQLSEEMDGLPASEYSAQGRAKQQAKGHLDQATDAMRQFEEKLADARYESPDSSQAQGMSDLADSASRRLADAGQAIDRGLSREGQGPADQAQEMAEQLAQDAQAYDESLSEAEKQKMLDRLAAAQRLLESMAGTRWSTISGGGPGGGHVYTNDPHRSAADTARLLARQFWSVALETKKRQSRSIEEEPSDVEFFEAENEFFETAARFRQERVEK